MKNDIKYHSQRPNITLVIEYVFLNTLWTLIWIVGDLPSDLRFCCFAAVAET